MRNFSGEFFSDQAKVFSSGGKDLCKSLGSRKTQQFATICAIPTLYNLPTGEQEGFEGLFTDLLPQKN